MLNELRNDGEEVMIDAFNMATLHIPQIVNELLVAHHQNGVLSSSELDMLGELHGLSMFLKNAFDGRHVILGF